MSTISVAIFKTEDDVHTNPPTPSLYDTHCDGQKKPFAEVFIYWDIVNEEWVESPTFQLAVPGVSSETIVALKVSNECDDTYAFLDIPYNDFRLKQLCCVIEELNEGLFLLTEDGEVIETEDGNGITA